MPFLTLLAIAVALAMDAFAVALATGICLRQAKAAQTLRMAGAFGLFQALMPIAGWLLGLSVREHIEAYDHWIAFVLLGAIGGKMLWEARGGPEEKEEAAPKDLFGLKVMFVLAVATSIDALAVGLSLAMLGNGIWYASVVIGVVTGCLSLVAIRLGHRLGRTFGTRMEVAGGILLIAIGLKVLVEHF